ncbi:protein NDR1-like [Juglans microcarpa x Juglans regia]|uniref:protein NDR1-like n=1 Tax=Juglans microcarpa x Juglans regia TaxID=2249226 RepID=UPI001B7DD144|nr:protein NDR1-like [Juglans microcarpa x Juglans regia]
MTEPAGGCCRCCCSFIFTLGLTSLFMWLSLRTNDPNCSVQNFYLPALNKTLNTPRNNTLIFMVRLDNTNKDKGVYYDNVSLTFYDSPNKSQSHLIGNYTIPGFHQGHHKKAEKSGETEVNMTLVFLAVAPNGTAEFRVDLATAVRFKILWWKTKKHRLTRGGSVLVDDKGAKVNKKGIKLRSGAPERGSYCAQVGVLVSLLVLLT